MRYGYKIITQWGTRSDEDFEAEMYDLGLKGWRLVNVVHDGEGARTAYFSKPV